MILGILLSWVGNHDIWPWKIGGCLPGPPSRAPHSPLVVRSSIGIVLVVFHY